MWGIILGPLNSYMGLNIDDHGLYRRHDVAIMTILKSEFGLMVV